MLDEAGAELETWTELEREAVLEAGVEAAELVEATEDGGVEEATEEEAIVDEDTIAEELETRQLEGLNLPWKVPSRIAFIQEL